MYTKVYDADGKLLIDNEPVTTVAMSTKTRDYMIQLLTGVVANGTGRKAAISGMDVGGKTGTTSADNDRWFAGITPYYVGVVWFGFDQPQSLQKFSTNPALELWTRVMTSTLEGYENAKFTLSTEMNKVSYCLDCGRLATDLCSNDIRGSRVATAYVAVEDVPKRNCDCHISVQLCGNAVANSFCPEEGLRTVSLLNYKRAFPSSKVFNVGDQSQCAPYELTEDQIAQGYIKPGPDTYQVCTVHTEPAPEPDNPFWPFWPTDPMSPRTRRADTILTRMRPAVRTKRKTPERATRSKPAAATIPSATSSTTFLTPDPGTAAAACPFCLFDARTLCVRASAYRKPI